MKNPLIIANPKKFGDAKLQGLNLRKKERQPVTKGKF
jgi:hypothetical protein